MSQALTSTLHFDVHACSTVFSDSRAEGTIPSTYPSGRASSREPTKKIKTKGAALLDFKTETDENNKGREGGKRENDEDPSMAGDMATTGGKVKKRRR
jgi:hypothetical protein